MSQLGRLTLSWVNKECALLGTDHGSYEWVDRDDPRVREVRLLNPVDSIGDTDPELQHLVENLLISGDALHALRSLTNLPEYARKYFGKIKLIYMDPPFNTGQAFAHYDDALEHSVWLTMMRDRLTLVRDLLRPDGSVWVHCDDSEQHRLRVVMDEIFGAANFKATIVWQKLYARKSNTDFSTSHDFIHVYCKNVTLFSRNLQPASPEQIARYKNPDNDPRGPWQSVSFHVRTDDPERRQDYRYKIQLPSGRWTGPPPGRHWNGKRPRYDQLLADNRLWFGADGDSTPRYKDFLRPEKIGLVPTTWWPRTEVGDNDESKNEIQALFPQIGDPFSTPKPERLLERIIMIGSNPEDIVLDCFAGSGTTAAVAHKMGRRWVAIEREKDTIETFLRPRLEKVINGEDKGGITQEVGWEKGGGFRVLSVAPSMYEQADEHTFLSPWVTNGRFAEVVRAQLGFRFDASPPFSGRKGRTRLAVVDGVADEGVIHAILDHLDEMERTVVVAKAATDDAATILQELSPGSQLKKAPRDLVAPKGRVVR